MEDVKVCKDCKWCEFKKDDPNKSTCINPEYVSRVSSKDRITGIVTIHKDRLLCTRLRGLEYSEYPLCDFQGKGFKPKEDIIEDEQWINDLMDRLDEISEQTEQLKTVYTFSKGSNLFSSLNFNKIINSLRRN